VPELVLAGSVMHSMPRMRKPWLRTCEMPKALIAALRVPTETHSPRHQHKISQEIHSGWDDDGSMGHVSPVTMKELEDTFLRGISEASEDQRISEWRDVGGALGEDLSFLNDQGLRDAAESSGRAQHNSENIPPLNLPKPSKPVKKIAVHANAESALSHRRARASKEELQPFLGAKLKKNLAKQGLLAQQLSLQPDEWDDDQVVNMLGVNFSSKEEERKAKHGQWYIKNLGPTFVKKRNEALARVSEKVEPAVLAGLGNTNRTTIVVANQDNWRSAQTWSLLSRQSREFISHPEDIKVSDIFRSREQRIETRHGVPVEGPRRETSQGRSGSCEPMLARDARDRLRQSTRFLHSRGNICKANATRAFVRDVLSRCSHGCVSLAAVSNTFDTPLSQLSQRNHGGDGPREREALNASDLSPSRRVSSRPTSRASSRAHTPDSQIRHLVSQVCVCVCVCVFVCVCV